MPPQITGIFQVFKFGEKGGVYVLLNAGGENAFCSDWLQARYLLYVWLVVDLHSLAYALLADIMESWQVKYRNKSDIPQLYLG